MSGCLKVRIFDWNIFGVVPNSIKQRIQGSKTFEPEPLSFSKFRIDCWPLYPHEVKKFVVNFAPFIFRPIIIVGRNFNKVILCGVFYSLFRFYWFLSWLSFAWVDLRWQTFECVCPFSFKFPFTFSRTFFELPLYDRVPSRWLAHSLIWSTWIEELLNV